MFAGLLYFFKIARKKLGQIGSIEEMIVKSVFFEITGLVHARDETHKIFGVVGKNFEQKISARPEHASDFRNTARTFFLGQVLEQAKIRHAVERRISEGYVERVAFFEAEIAGKTAGF